MSAQSRKAASEHPTGPLPVIAGLDGSASSFAAAEAAARSLPLELVHAFTWPWIYPPLISDPETHAEPDPRIRAADLLATTADRIRQEHRGMLVTTHLIDGHAPAVLVERSQRAALLFLGHRGAGGFTQLLAGSTAIHAAAHAHCPVLVTRGAPTPPDAPVLVGVDGSAGARRAAWFAFDVAARRRVPLTVLSVWPADHAWPDSLAAAGYPPPSVPDMLAESLGDCTAAYPDVAVRTEIVRDSSPAAPLIHAAYRAALVVVGSRGLGGLRGMLLGSVSRALIEHAPCPVAVVRPTEALP